MISNKGQIGLPLHFKRFGQSPNYYFNKYGVRPSNGKPPGRWGKYMVMNLEIKKGWKAW
ncbi:hypothetical protein ACRQ5D_32735 [Mucilaginibacter sp. P25]|uniref:hypothetical protein n=1 Tax=Mucilaginibacter TaxID=423349 RepID=UPI0015A26C47|nr:hypothetical protein [Mucilaginibacter gossypii]